MDTLEALFYLHNDPNHVRTHISEWVQAGMWSGVQEVLMAGTSKKWTPAELDRLIETANNY